MDILTSPSPSLTSTSTTPSQPVQSSDLAVFTLFPKLPPELRFMIWGNSANQTTRFVEISSSVYSIARRRSRRPRLFQLLMSPTLAPAILHCSFESRREGLKHYEILALSGFTTVVYINWDSDYLSVINNKRYGISTWDILMNRGVRSLTNSLDHTASINQLGTKCRLIAFSPLDYPDTTRIPFNLLEALDRVLVITDGSNETFENSDLQIQTIYASSQAQIRNINQFLGQNPHYWSTRFHLSLENNPTVGITYAKLANSHHRRMTSKGRLDRSARKIGQHWASGAPEKPLIPIKETFLTLRLPILKGIAKDLGLSEHGRRVDLIARLNTLEELRFTQAMADWKNAMVVWENAMAKRIPGSKATSDTDSTDAGINDERVPTSDFREVGKSSNDPNDETNHTSENAEDDLSRQVVVDSIFG